MEWEKPGYITSLLFVSGSQPMIDSIMTTVSNGNVISVLVVQSMVSKLQTKEDVAAKIDHWKFPFHGRICERREEKFRLKWRDLASKHLSSLQCQILRTETLGKRFWNANCHKQSISLAQLLQSVLNLWKERESESGDDRLHSPIYPCDRLLTLLIRQLSITTQVEVDSLHVPSVP